MTVAIVPQQADTATLLAFAALVAFVIFSASQFRAWYRLRHVPGPFWCSISVFPMLRRAWGGKYHEELKKLGDKYGPLIRIGPNDVMFSDPETFRKLSAVRSPYTKGEFYEFARLVPGEDNLFSMRDEEKRRELKAKMASGYAGRETGGFEAGIDRHVTGLIDLIERSYISTPSDYRPIDFAQKSQFFALDVICELGFGAAPGFLSQDKDLFNYLEINNAFFPVLIILSNFPWLARLTHKWPLKYSLPKVGDKVGFGALMSFAQALVDARLEPGAVKPGNDMMQSFIRNGMTRNELIQEVFLEMIAGSDTTASVIRMTLLSLISTPNAYAALRREIDDGVSSGTIPPMPTLIHDAEARNMPYLQAVIREGLRLYPPATGLLHKAVPRGGDTLHGYKLPAGTQVGQNLGGITRSKELFGDDADVFRPERWLEAAAAEDSGERLKEMQGAVDLVFGFGKYQCLGKQIALTELNKVFVELLRRYDFAIAKAESPMTLWSVAFWVANDFWLRVTRRTDAA